ncbi:hypothetical protein KY336_02010 [Candidatus Woesearchaeota archaeon]|nr:hypothetical protein [Candidatus Woesearchaeota archaeon]
MADSRLQNLKGNQRLVQITQIGGGKKTRSVRGNTQGKSGTGPEVVMEVAPGMEPPLHSFVVVAPLGAKTTGKKVKWKIVKRGVNPREYNV